MRYKLRQEPVFEAVQYTADSKDAVVALLGDKWTDIVLLPPSWQPVHILELAITEPFKYRITLDYGDWLVKDSNLYRRYDDETFQRLYQPVEATI